MEYPSPRSRPRISLFVHDLSGNPIVRAAPLADALADRFDVQVLGLLPTGRELYAPYRDRFEYRYLHAPGALPAVLAAAARLARLADGDLVYAFKPLFSTLWPALLAGRRHLPRPVLLDVEDDEWESRSVDAAGWDPRRLADTHRFKARLAHPLTRYVDGVTVSTTRLQARYGGRLVRHGPDEALFDPGRPELGDRAALRRRFGLPPGRKLALFAGVPRPHKGWSVLLDALQRAEAAGWDLVAAGVLGGTAFDEARARLGGRFHHVGGVSNREMPALLAAVDAVPVPQRRAPYAEAQLPAKAMEAMAMAVPVVASSIGDLPRILGEGTRGWLVPPEDPGALAGALAAAADPCEAARRGAAAREWYLAEAGAAALRRTLTEVVERAVEQWRGCAG